jgi:hypothetical protein
MPEVAFVMSGGQDYALRALAETLGYELERQAVPSSLHLGGFPAPRPQRVDVVLDPFTYSRLEGEQALPGEALLRRTIFLCAEPPPSAADEERVELLGLAGAVFALDQRSVVNLHRAGIHARLLKPGYSRSLDHVDAESPRPIDVLFLGCQSTRRASILRRVSEVLGHRNCRLEIPAAQPTAEEVDSPLAEGRWPLLTQAKVLINLHRREESRFEWRHALDAVHAGAVVVTEHASGISPLVPGEHLFAADADSLPYVVDAVLDDEQRIVRVRSQAYERLRTWLPYGLSVAVLRAAIVELVGEPIPPEAALNRAAA